MVAQFAFCVLQAVAEGCSVEVKMEADVGLEAVSGDSKEGRIVGQGGSVVRGLAHPYFKTTFKFP
jgi:hypothetical protein